MQGSFSIILFMEFNALFISFQLIVKIFIFFGLGVIVKFFFNVIVS